MPGSVITSFHFDLLNKVNKIYNEQTYDTIFKIYCMQYYWDFKY